MPDADEIFFLFDLSLQVRNFCGRGEDELLRLPYVEIGAQALVREILNQMKRVLARRQCAPRDLELRVQFAELKIGGRESRKVPRNLVPSMRSWRDSPA
jgi:hypothetical protein